MRRVAVIFSALLVASLARGQAQTQEGVARTRFNKARDLFIAKQYVPALAEFRAAAELYESPNTRLYIGRCERELGHTAAAYVELERAASEAADRASSDPRYASTQSAAKDEASALEGKLGHVTVVAPNLPDDATITLNGNDLGTAAVGVPAPVDPGPVEIVAEAPGYMRVHKTASVNAGESIEIKIKLEKAAAATSSSTEEKTTPSDNPPDDQAKTEGSGHSHGVRNAGLVIGGIGLAGIGVFATFATMAQSRFNQLQTACNNGPCDPSYQSQIDEGQTFQTVANVALVAGATLVTTGVIILIVAAVSGKPATASAAPEQAWTGGATPLAGGGWMFGVGRAF